ncbi:hypothetical protein [Oceaniferula spumae]|uniref:hypothetical protein n=1 Tax=Oceaniferula spumae TaxID=2979115 RepID=UPI003F4EFFD2
MFIVSCRKAPETVQVTETRELTMWDKGSDPLVAPMPPEWRQIPGTQLRIFNYRFGDDGEVYVSRARGGVLPNVNRWLGQFGKPPLQSLDELPKIKMLGVDAVVVSATGKFAGGMGKAAKENAAVLGVIADHGAGLLTVKMIGSADEVAAERERVLNFCENLRINQPDEQAHPGEASTGESTTDGE